MDAGRLSSLLQTLARHPLAQASGRALERALELRRVPLPHAIAADRHELATSDAGVISYYADTRSGGRPVVLLHGIHAAASAYEVRPLFESLRGERSVYALELPGFGFSERSARDYRPATYVHAIEHLLRQVATSEAVDVIALSLSSEFAARVALEMPELVRSLVLLSPTGFATRSERGRLERHARVKPPRAAGPLSELPLGPLLYELLVTRPSLHWFLRRSFERAVDPGLLAYSYATSHQAGAHRAPLAFLAGELFPAGDPLKLYARLHTPTLVLYDRDPYTGFGQLDALVGRHSSMAARRIPHTRGLPHFDAPQQTAEALREFYERLDSPRALGGFHSRFVGSA